ncbi:5-formyltetrahydrofolate cyclo-ligase [Rhabdochromatium marinum]|nr:5-formyltetrahydrofolate cyclo-ligase [Rhabdochromatium marinum]
MSLRRQLRAKRRAIAPSIQRRHARQAAAHLRKLPGIGRARHIALYMAVDGELDPSAIRQQFAQASRRWYLPVISSQAPPKIRFYPDPLPRQRRPNSWGIPEPDCRRQHPVKLSSLDLVLLPLVGFDHRCQRIGMGLGFYDRCFGNIRADARRYRRPRLIGLAHECQRIKTLKRQPWDVALDAVLTEKHLYSCR